VFGVEERGKKTDESAGKKRAGKQRCAVDKVYD
jgi:hypothetical protein